MVPISEILKLDMVVKNVWVESSESMRGELEDKLRRAEKVRSESKCEKSVVGGLMVRKWNG